MSIVYLLFALPFIWIQSVSGSESDSNNESPLFLCVVTCFTGYGEEIISWEKTKYK